MRLLSKLALFALAAAATLVAVDAGAHKDRAPKDADLADPSAYVDAHNRVRAAVAEPAGYKGAWTPPPPLSWSDEVAASAQGWANHLRDDRQCKLEHDDNSRLGENLAVGKDMNVAQAVQMWADEARHYSYSPVYAFEIPTGHYTQMVWRKTTNIGCGFATCGSKVIIVCRYSPPGNHIDAAPY
jgi:uncharacterized protein YkwD